ncbi:MAG: secretin N-terminal domain-containing protein [Candidatus Margulisbacteria bacterium]|nr:secretin N-terminal domain-containing protein [Candidatus Margulisiibacteriota bacterium]
MSKIKSVWIRVIGLLVVLTFVALAGVALAKESVNVSFAKGKVYLNLKDADIKSVLQIFAKATGSNIVASDDVTGKVTVTFSGILPKDGLEAVLRTKGLDWFEDHGTIFVSGKKILRTYYLANARPSDLQTTLTAVLPAGSIVTADDSYNVLVIQTTSDYLPRLEKLINELDVLCPQVMIEVKMIQVNDGLGGTLGLDLNYTKNTGVTTGNVQTTGQANRALTSSGTADSTAQGFYAHVLSIFSTGSLEAFLSALAVDTKYDIVATPRLTTLSNKEARLLIGSKLGYKTSIVTQTSTTQQVEFLNVGTQLVLTPTVSKNGYIRMRVSPKISEGQVVNDLPQEDTTETHNEVTVKDGQTFVIGGLMKEKDVQTDYGLPFLMDIPFLGSLFRRTVTSKTKSELLVFVTPHILTAEYLETISPTVEGLKKKAEARDARLIH